MEHWPAIRTKPAGLKESGFWPFLAGTLAVLLGIPALGWVLMFIAEGVFGKGPNVPDLITQVLLVARVSPLFSWAALLVALPVSAFLAARGWAGWGMAAFGGFIGGTVTIWAMDGSFGMTPETMFFGITGVGFGVIYWLAIRLTHPQAIGIPPRSVAQ